MKTPRSPIAKYIAERSLKAGVNKRLTRSVAAFLLSERRVSELASLMRDVQTDWADAGYVEVTTYSAHPLNQTLRREITNQVKAMYPKAREVQITEVLDPSIVGGVRLSLANKQWDMSVEAKLNKFKQLTNANV